MSSTRTIKIKKGYPDGTLDLSDGGHTQAYKKDYIIWTIKKHQDITSIEKIEKKSGTDIFKTPPKPNGIQPGSDWIAEIKDNASDYSEYIYSITWNGTWGRRIYDPKISVKPSKLNFIKLLTGITLALLGLLSLEFLRRKMNKE